MDKTTGGASITSADNDGNTPFQHGLFFAHINGSKMQKTSEVLEYKNSNTLCMTCVYQRKLKMYLN